MSSYVGYRDNGLTDEHGLKAELRRLFSAGLSIVDNPSSMLVSQHASGAGSSADVAVGDANIGRPDGLYSYWCWTDAITVVSAPAANVSLPRIDTLVAYIDLAVTNTSVSNNPGALKFTFVQGVAAGSPTAATDANVQSALGTGVPWTRLADILRPANNSNITSGNITDRRSPIAFKGRLIGGSSNSIGHLVPNLADGKVLVSTDNNNVAASNLALDAILRGSATINAPFSTGPEADVTGLSNSVVVPDGGRKIQIEFYAPQIYNSNDGLRTQIFIYEGSTLLQTAYTRTWSGANGGTGPILVKTPPISASAGSHTYKVRVSSSSGTMTVFADTAALAYLTTKAV